MKQTENFSVIVKKEVPRAVLEAVFVTALEGGSNYWYFLPDDAIGVIRKAVPKEQDQYLSSAFSKAVLDHNVRVPIHDAEDEDELLGYISASTIQDRLQKLSEDKDYNWALERELNEDGDAESSDVVFQYLAFGEVIFS